MNKKPLITTSLTASIIEVAGLLTTAHGILIAQNVFRTLLGVVIFLIPVTIKYFREEVEE